MNDPRQGSEAAAMNGSQHGSDGVWGAMPLYPASPTAPVKHLLPRALFAAFLVLALAIGGFGLGLGLGVRGVDIAMLALALGTFALGCAPLVLDQGRLPEQRHVLLALVSLVLMVHFVVPALMLYLPATGPIDASSTSFTNLMPAHVVAGQQMVLLGLLSLQLGYALPLGRLVAAAIPPPRVDWPRATCLLVALGFLGLGWSISLLGLLGLLPAAAGTGVVGVLASGRNYANALLAYAYLRYRSRGAALLIAGNVLALLALGLLTSDKQDALIGPAIVVLTAMVLTKRIRVRWIALGFLALMVIYPVSNFVRKGLLPGASATELVLNPLYTLSAISSYVASGEVADHVEMGFDATARRIDGLGIASVIIRDTPRVSPFQYGRTLGLYFVSFVPRILWQDKPNIQIGQWITDVYGSGPHINARTAPTPIGEFYLNFGVAGVVFGLLLLGIVLRLAHEGLSRRGATAPSVLAQVIFLVQFGVEFMGSIAGVYGQLTFILVPLLLLHLLVRTLTPTVLLRRGALSES